MLFALGLRPRQRVGVQKADLAGVTSPPVPAIDAQKMFRRGSQADRAGPRYGENPLLFTYETIASNSSTS